MLFSVLEIYRVWRPQGPLSQKPGRTVRITFATVAMLLLSVALVAGGVYLVSSSELGAKDQEILHLRAEMLSQNATALGLELKITELEVNITGLDLRIATLQEGQVTSAAELASLGAEVLKLENQSAWLNLELSVVAQSANLSVVTLVENRTMAVPPGGTPEVVSQPGGHNGTLVFVSPEGCPSSGVDVQSAGSKHTVSYILNSSAPLLRSDYRALGPDPFSVYLPNVGPAPVGCTFSLLYVQQ